MLSDKASTVQTGEQKSKTVFWRNLICSALVVSTLLFLATNLILVVLRPVLNVSPLQLPVRSTWEWWRTRSLLSEGLAPDVVLLGSSLMMIPVTMADADFLNKPVDAVMHPHFEALENKLSKCARNTSPTNPTCFNFALPGAMISDDYMVTRALLISSRKPKVLVLGLSLRDFIDNGVESASSTPTFQYFRHFFPEQEIEELTSVSFISKAEQLQNKILFLWNKRLELQTLASSVLRRAARNSLGDSPYKDEMPDFLRPRALDVVAEGSEAAFKTSITEGAFVMKPGAAYPYKDNTREYKKRFRTGNQALFANQAEFFDRLLSLANKNNIQTLIVNMPLTKKNMELMPKGAYDRYMETLAQAKQRHHAVIVDLNQNPSRYSASDFQDTVHMNPQGAQKFTGDLAAALSGESSLRCALRLDEQQAPKAAVTRTAPAY